jgi:hypothetical protein
MKKITLLLAFIGMITLQSCVREEVIVQDPYDNDTISEVFQYNNVNFTSGNGYRVLLTFPHSIFNSDMVLVYRRTGNTSSGAVWKLLPETYYFDDGTLDFGYRNDFTRFDAEVVLFGYDLPNLSSAFRLNQTFRVVVIPAFFGNRTANSVDFKDYEAVINYYGIDDKNVTEINL